MTAGSFVTTRQLVLRRGDIHTLYSVPGMVLVCIEGHVRRIEHIPQAEGGAPYAVQVPLRQGESHFCEQAGPLMLAADGYARLLCLQQQAVWRVMAARLLQRVAKYAMMTNIRRGVEQSGSSSGS